MDVDNDVHASDDDAVASAPKGNVAGPSKKKTASETYTKVTHILPSSDDCLKRVHLSFPNLNTF
jgi:hypothetical protein